MTGVDASGAGVPPRTPRSTHARLGLVAATLAAISCAHNADPAGPRHSRKLVLAFDDNHATAVLALPSLTYESMLRFDLPAGKHRPHAICLQAQSAGTVAITLYENGLLETPGEVIHEVTHELSADDVSDGKDGRWVVEDLDDVTPIAGAVWIGVRKVAGAPALWTSSVVSGQAYLRDRDPARALGLLPVKRTPMIRLELWP